MKTASTIITALFMLNPIIGQEFDSDKLDHYFDVLEENDKAMGSVALAKSGNIIYSRTFGYCDYENKIKPDSNSIYAIGSISKTFTVTLIMLAVESDKLSLDQKLSTFFPEMPRAEEISIEHLLRHQSGIPNFTNSPFYLNWNTQEQSRSDMVTRITLCGSNFVPGSKQEYSNSNYLLLSYILEDIYEKSYTEILEQHITEPLGLMNTSIDGSKSVQGQKCKSYNDWAPWQKASETHPSVALGAGGIKTTSNDLILFAEALLGGRLLNDESLQAMMNIKENLGMGLLPYPLGSKMAYGHGGTIDGFRSDFAHFPEDDLTYVLLLNASNYNRNDIAIAVLSAVFDKPFEIPNFQAYAVAAEDLDQYTGSYSSEQLPVKLKVSKDKNTLIIQGSGQPAMVCVATEKDKFEFTQAGAVFIFIPSEDKMILEQSGQRYEYFRE